MTTAIKETYLAKLPEHSVQPLWTVMQKMVTARPTPRAEVTIWRYESMRPLLIQAGQIVSDKEAERRVLMLVNPALDPPYTTDSIYAGLQLINPGEVAPAHRHRAFALRFIIEGERGFTAINGEKISMEKGDVILTPSWEWHDHGHDGTEPMIWLDGLDLPLYHSLPIHFAEPYDEPTYPSKPVVVSVRKFPWAAVKSELDRSKQDSSKMTYRKSSGVYISDTLGAHAQRVRAGKSSDPSRDTCSYIYHVKAGSGKTLIEGEDGESETLEWTERDTFVIPAWKKITHIANMEEDVYFFILSDRPWLDNLKLYRSE